MNLEIERKYLIDNAALPEIQNNFDGHYVIQQGYVCVGEPHEVRIRLDDKDDTTPDMNAHIMIKTGTGLIRNEVAARIPYEEGQRLMETLEDRIIKTRYKSGRWEIDVFYNKLRGLIIAEIELVDAQEVVDFPAWLAPFVLNEVTNDSRYKNAQLAKNPQRIILN